jgi:DNA-directed RNA polymerase I subunit RPA12
MFCPYSGALLQLDAVRNVATSNLSGYSISLDGEHNAIVGVALHSMACSRQSAPLRARPLTAGRSPCFAELEDKVVIVHDTDMNDYARRFGLEPLVKSEERQEEEEALRGRTRATVDEVCPKCGHEGMEFYTLQLRSADEGQTVFYECAECGHKYSQNN